MRHRPFKLSSQYHPDTEEPEVIFVSKKLGTIYKKYNGGKGIDLNHPIQVDLSKYKKADDILLYTIYHLKN